MQLIGDFIVRRVADEILAIPVGEMAKRFNGMLLLNDVSQIIWQLLVDGTDLQSLVAAVTEKFEVSGAQAEQDIQEFLDKLRKLELLAE